MQFPWSTESQIVKVCSDPSSNLSVHFLDLFSSSQENSEGYANMEIAIVKANMSNAVFSHLIVICQKAPQDSSTSCTVIITVIKVWKNGSTRMRLPFWKFGAWSLEFDHCTHFSGSFTLEWLQIWKFIRNSAGTQVNWRCFWPYHSQFILKQRCWLCENLFTQQASGMISMGRRGRLMSPKPHHYDKDLLENQHMLDSPLSYKTGQMVTNGRYWGKDKSVGWNHPSNTGKSTPW